jgi:hypothetical protein
MNNAEIKLKKGWESGFELHPGIQLQNLHNVLTAVPSANIGKSTA